ncbi:hypothetical protein LC048_20530 [Mesobacillus subterraneus]|uniref:hypothetical protein n=1 Tax=Mesobacillus subterraneus TaxID=285983 RepID=UPI001CFF2C0A|nr:hypothetical protein [Mesobacillus subterraneus]WLR54764.1 hypothetical protein LC048_20530 [Mesobacillus subterraneus]
MNSHLMEILSRDIIKSLPIEQREVYEYVVRLEDDLAQQAETSDEFMSLLVKHAPHRQAARHFNLTFGQLMALMREAENYINQQLEKKSENMTWVDLTEQVLSRRRIVNDKIKYFYFSVNEVHS